jgi:hypothetical protein
LRQENGLLTDAHSALENQIDNWRQRAQSQPNVAELQRELAQTQTALKNVNISHHILMFHYFFADN